jgi:hypothetical protein
MAAGVQKAVSLLFELAASEEETPEEEDDDA